MKWQEGQSVECAGLSWGTCYVTMVSPDLIVIYCPQYEIVTTGSPEQLEQAGWRSSHARKSRKVIYIAKWLQKHRPQQHPVPTH